MVTTTVVMPSTSGIAAAASDPNTASRHNQDDRKVPLLGLGDVVLGAGLRGRAEGALADDVEPDLAVLDLTRLIAVDPDLLSQLLGDVHRAGVVEVHLQGDDVGPVRLGRGLRGLGTTLTLGTSAATRSSCATAVFMSSNEASARGAATNANGDAPWSGKCCSSSVCTCSDCEPATSNPPPVRFPDWFSPR